MEGKKSSLCLGISNKSCNLSCVCVHVYVCVVCFVCMCITQIASTWEFVWLIQFLFHRLKFTAPSTVLSHLAPECVWGVGSWAKLKITNIMWTLVESIFWMKHPVKSHLLLRWPSGSRRLFLSPFNRWEKDKALKMESELHGWIPCVYGYTVLLPSLCILGINPGDYSWGGVCEERWRDEDWLKANAQLCLTDPEIRGLEQPGSLHACVGARLPADCFQSPFCWFPIGWRNPLKAGCALRWKSSFVLPLKYYRGKQRKKGKDT